MTNLISRAFGAIFGGVKRRVRISFLTIKMLLPTAVMMMAVTFSGGVSVATVKTFHETLNHSNIKLIERQSKRLESLFNDPQFKIYSHKFAALKRKVADLNHNFKIIEAEFDNEDIQLWDLVKLRREALNCYRDAKEVNSIFEFILVQVSENAQGETKDFLLHQTHELQEFVRGLETLTREFYKAANSRTNSRIEIREKGIERSRRAIKRIK